MWSIIHKLYDSNQFIKFGPFMEISISWGDAPPDMLSPSSELSTISRKLPTSRSCDLISVVLYILINIY